MQNYISNGINDGQYASTILIDFKKDFNTVDRELLIDTLMALRCDLKALSWFRSSLSNRRQYIVHMNKKTGTIENNYGVPQGSKLGPLLFSVFLMKIASLGFKGQLVIHADVLTLLYRNKQIDSLEADMNSDLKLIETFVSSLRLIVNAKKTAYMVFAGRKVRRNLIVKFDNQLLDEIKTTKLLGVIFTSGFSFKEHISAVALKACKRIAMLSRLRHMLPKFSLNRMYKASINPLFT